MRPRSNYNVNPVAQASIARREKGPFLFDYLSAPPTRVEGFGAGAQRTRTKPLLPPFGEQLLTVSPRRFCQHTGATPHGLSGVHWAPKLGGEAGDATPKRDSELRVQC